MKFCMYVTFLVSQLLMELFLFLIQEAFRAFHNDLSAVRKYLKPIHRGQVEDVSESKSSEEAMKDDFDKLRQTAHNMVSFPLVPVIAVQFISPIFLESYKMICVGSQSLP